MTDEHSRDPGKPTALLIALHYPPAPIVSGTHRTLHLAQELVKAGWHPVILSISVNALNPIDESLLDRRDPGITVIRTPGLDTKQHLSILGRYPYFLAVPDRYWTWPQLIRSHVAAIVERYRPRVVWSTYPFASAHKVASLICDRYAIPWVADFRDPMVTDAFPTDHLHRKVHRRYERFVALQADALTFASPSSLASFAALYPATARKLHLVLNGFDAALMSDSPSVATTRTSRQRIVLLHSGHVYRDLRDPTGLLRALNGLKQRDPDLYARIEMRFRASSNDALILQLAEKHGVSDAVTVMPPLPHAEAIQEMRDADYLVLLQRSNANLQIPGKLYEYACAMRPILGLVDPAGDSARAMRAMGYESIVSPDTPSAVLELFLRIPTGDPGLQYIAPRTILEKYTRQEASRQFIALFRRYADGRGRAEDGAPLPIRHRFRVATRMLSPGGARGRLSILSFHRVLEQPDALLPFEPDVRAFEARLWWLKEQFNVLPLSEACIRLREGSLPPRAAAVTFDDGYRSTYTQALPVLRRLGVPATCFISTGFTNGRPLFNESVIHALRQTRKSHARFDMLDLGLLDLSTVPARSAALTLLLQRLKYLPVAQRNAIVESIGRELDVKPAPGEMMSRDEILRLADAGIEIGAHTRNHPILKSLSDTDAFEEIAGSRHDLAEILGAPPTLFAYPNGKRSVDFSERHVEMVRQAGFEFAFTTDAGAARAKDPELLIPRFTPWDADELRFRLRLLSNLAGLTVGLNDEKHDSAMSLTT